MTKTIKNSSHTNLQKKLNELANLIDSHLDQFLPKDKELPPLIHESMRYSIFAGGKRLRPILCLLTYEMLGGEQINEAIVQACSLELVHTYSLIHDDLPAMDNDDLRRGKPTNHIKFDEATAILAGDALQTFAFELLSSNVKDPDIALLSIKCLSRAIGTKGMIGGQVLDMQGEKIKSPTITDVEMIHQRKTGALLQASLEMGAIAAQASGPTLFEISKIGALLGYAFQIADDLLDLESSSEDLGKTVHKDQKVNKITYPRIAGIENAKLKARELTDEAIKLLEKYEEKAELLISLASYIVERKK